MITKKIITAAEKVMPVEKKFRDSIYDFYVPRKNRVIMGALLGLFFTLSSMLLCFCSSIWNYSVICSLYTVPALAFCGMFFGNIKRPSFPRYVISTTLLAAAIHAFYTAYMVLNWAPREIWDNSDELALNIRDTAVYFARIFVPSLVITIAAGAIVVWMFKKASRERK